MRLRPTSTAAHDQDAKGKGTNMSDTTWQPVISSSEQVAWTIESVLGPDARFDLKRPLLPDSLANVAKISCLDEAERLTLNHIRGNAYLYLFSFVEEYIIATAVRHADAEVFGDHAALRAFLRFAEEEVKHQEMFRRALRLFEANFGHKCDVIQNPEAVAEVILSHKPMAVLLITLHLEIMTQQHFVESFRRGTTEELDPLFRQMLRNHWLEEAQHAKIDVLELERLAADATPELREESIDDYIKIVVALDGLLIQQAANDVTSLGRILGRTFSETEHREILDAQMDAYRRTFVGLGLWSPALIAEVQRLSPAGARRVAELAKKYPV
jgi:hypothetical protein